MVPRLNNNATIDPVNNLSLLIFYVQPTTMSHKDTIISADDFLFEHYDNLAHLDPLELTKSEKQMIIQVLNLGNHFHPELADGIFSRYKYNFFPGYIRDTNLHQAWIELRKNKENCNWDLHTRCTKSFLNIRDEYADPPYDNEELDDRVRTVRTLIMLFPCHLAFCTLDRVVEQHKDLIGKGNVEVPDYHAEYLANGGWCSMDDYDDEIWFAWYWHERWTYDTIINKCVEFNDEILLRNASGLATTGDIRKNNAGMTLGCPSSIRSQEIKEENAAFAEWKNMHKNDALLQQLINMRKKACWVMARHSVSKLIKEIRRWKHVVQLMPSPLAFQALEDVMKIHENFLGSEKKLERYKKRGGWMTKKDFDEKTMAAWIRVQVLECRFRNLK